MCDKQMATKIRVERRRRAVRAGSGSSYGFGIRSVALIIALPLTP